MQKRVEHGSISISKYSHEKESLQKKIGCTDTSSKKNACHFDKRLVRMAQKHQ
jgi:hypothetical protein